MKISVDVQRRHFRVGCGRGWCDVATTGRGQLTGLADSSPPFIPPSILPSTHSYPPICPPLRAMSSMQT